MCFKCHGTGHYKNEGPNSRAFTAIEWTEINERTGPRAMLVHKNGHEEAILPPTPEDETEGSYVLTKLGTLQRTDPDQEDSDTKEERELIHPETEHHSLLIRRNFHTTPKQKVSNQRENIFQTKCRIQGKLCDIIIDGGSETNCVSKEIVKELKLKTQQHPNPYKLRWLDSKAEGHVKRQCLVKLAIGSYHDSIMCDVLDMNACHVLLGRPWQHDLKTIHDGFSNVYTIKHEGKLKDLLPLPPHKSIAPTPPLKTVQLITKRECSREIHTKGRLILLFGKESTTVASDLEHPQLKSLLHNFRDVFPDDLPRGLPPLRGIEHQIDLVPGAQIPNKPVYRTNPQEALEL